MDYKWISVKDQLPGIGEEVIVYCQPNNDGMGKVTALCRYIRYEGATNFYWDNDYPGSGNLYIQEAITHWMPLPEPPKQ